MDLDAKFFDNFHQILVSQQERKDIHIGFKKRGHHRDSDYEAEETKEFSISHELAAKRMMVGLALSKLTWLKIPLVFEASEQLSFLFEVACKTVDSLKQAINKLSSEASRLHKDKVDISNTLRDVIAKAQTRENQIIEKVRLFKSESPSHQRKKSKNQGPARAAGNRLQRHEPDPA